MSEGRYKVKAPTRGGYRPGAGRPKGARTKKTQEQIEFVKATGATPLEYLLSVMRDEQREPELRIDAAKAAAPYVHPKLAQTDVNLTGDLKLLTDQELNDELAGLLEDPEIAALVARAGKTP